jgi:hypothetical protein
MPVACFPVWTEAADGYLAAVKYSNFRFVAEPDVGVIWLAFDPCRRRFARKRGSRPTYGLLPNAYRYASPSPTNAFA